jgi:hypothetical protein
MELLAFELLSACQGAVISTETCRLSASQRQAFIDLAQKQSKSEKIEEWKSLPIRDSRQRQTWWSAKQGVFLRPGASPLNERHDDFMNGGMASVSGQAGCVRSVDRLPSFAPASSQPALFAVSPSTSMYEGPEIDTPESVSHGAGIGADTRASEQDQDAVAPSLPIVPTGDMSPPASRDVAADRWRKYF